jgi:hypothetical protein
MVPENENLTPSEHNSPTKDQSGKSTLKEQVDERRLKLEEFKRAREEKRR